MKPLVLAALTLAAACSTDPLTTNPHSGEKTRECAAIFAQDLLPTFEIQIDDAEWAALIDEFKNWQEREAQGLDLKPYHPLISFRFGDQVATDAMIRLRGNPCCSWVDDKMQFQISFNENDPDGRFLGRRKILLDAPRYNRSFLKERLALAVLRDMGMPAPCANNALLYVNGVYYGLYTHLEKVDREFLERNFADPDGNLYKKGRELETNEETATSAEIRHAQQFFEVTTIDTMAPLIDLDAMVLEIAGEAWIPDNDGFWGGGGNYYTYDDPTSGKLILIPWDLDSSYDTLPHDTDPITWIKPDSFGRPHVDAIFNDPTWRDRYLGALRAGLPAYDVARQQARIDAWAAQIHDAAAADPTKQFTTESHEIAVQDLRGYIPRRVEFMRTWLGVQ